MTRAVARPMPGSSCNFPLATSSAGSAPDFSSERAAVRNARALKRLSPLVSSSVAISSSTIATACLSIGALLVGRFVDVIEAQRRKFDRFRRRHDRAVALQLATRQDVREVVAVRARRYARPLLQLTHRLDGDIEQTQARPTGAYAEREQQIHAPWRVLL